MFRKLKIMATLFTFVVIGAAIFAAPSASAFGQCGGSVSTGSQLYNAWQAMGVTSQSAEIAKSAGFHRMDGSFKRWMEERVVKAKLASTASPEDFGCNPGTVFSVGPRAIAKGTSVMVALPLKFAKSDVSVTPCSGCKRVVISAHVVGKTDCSNPLKGVVRVVVYVKVHKHHPHHKPPKCTCHHKHKKPKPTCEAIGKVTGPAGSCVNQTVTVTPKQECEANNHSGTNCQQTTVTIVNNCGNVAVGNEANVGQGGNCNTGGEQTCVGQGNCIVEEKPCSCTPPPPCECKPPTEPESPKVTPEKIQEVLTGHSRPLCVTVTPPSGATVQFEVEYGERSNGGKGVYNASANKYCVTYTAPTEEPPHTCVEAISSELPPNTKCDIAEVMVTCSSGAKPVTVRWEIPIIQEPSWE